MNAVLKDAIKENLQFQSTDKIEIEYKLHAAEHIELENRYHISEIAKGTDLDKALNMLMWVNRNIKHTGNYDNSDQQDALTLLEVAFDKDYGINCLAMSIILCECLLASGVKARVMYMMPEAVEDGDNHVVVEAYVSELNKWIMLDPTYGSYCMDSDKTILNLYEIRNCIANGTEYLFSESINYNGIVVDDIDDVKDYYAKNLFFLRCKSIQGYGYHREYGYMIEIAPLDFDVHKRMVDNLQYRINTYGDFEIFRIWMEYEKNLKNKYVDIEFVY